MSSKLCILALAAVCALPVFADPVDDAIMLTQKGASEEVLVAWSQRHSMNLSAQDIVRLKNGGVSDKVIAALVNSSSNQPQQSVAAGYQQPPPSTTTYVETPTYYYSDGTPYYYSSYGYPYYGWYGSGVGLGLNFNFGHSGRGYHSFGGGHRR